MGLGSCGLVGGAAGAASPRRGGDRGCEATTFLAQGVWDFNAPPTRWAGVPDTFRDCTYVAFERSGHYPFYEENAAFTDWIRTFMEYYAS